MFPVYVFQKDTSFALLPSGLSPNVLGIDIEGSARKGMPIVKAINELPSDNNYQFRLLRIRTRGKSL